jgi:hypothetical protein
MALPRGPQVIIGFHNWGMVHTKFMDSVIQCLGYEGKRIGGVLNVVSPYVTEARNRVVHKFLQYGQAKWLLMVDADIEFPEDAVSSCIYLAEANNLQVLAGDYALGNAGHSLFAKDPNSELCQPLGNLEPNVLYRDVYGAGTGWLFMRKDALEKVKEAYPGPWHWFDHDPVPIPDVTKKESYHPALQGTLESEKGGFNEAGTLRMGEDLSFCRRLHKVGVEVCGLTGLRLIHHKSKGIVSQELSILFEGNEGVIAVPNPFIPLMKEMEEKKNGSNP